MTTKVPLVSVIMASYNHEKYVGRAVRSVLDQSLQDFELVITDDGSRDKTVAQIAKFADPRIRLFRSPSNLGQFVATNNCLRQARGEYVAVLNSDDAFLPAKLEKQVEFLTRHPEVGAVFSRVRIVDEQDRVRQDKKMFSYTNLSRFEWLNRFFYGGNCLCHPSVLIRRQCHETIGGYDERYAQLADYDLWIRLCMRYEIHILPEELVAFRVLPQDRNMSARRRADSVKRRWWEHRHILDNFLSIRDPALLLKVFPEARRYVEQIDEELAPFVLASLALQAKTRRRLHEDFALETMFRLLGTPQTAEALSRRFGFGHGNFIQLTGQYDVFNTFAMRQMRAQRRQSRGGLWANMVRNLRKLRTGL